ncbi:MAG: DUF4282 domain-containing protein [Hyphomonadaceae bacterium]
MEFVNRFLSFDKLIGSVLVKVIYWIGIIGIVLGVLSYFFMGFSAMRYSFMMGLGMIVFAPIGGLIGLIFWRFYCELFIILFKIANDLSELKSITRDRSAPPPAT